ncbi:MAG: restriction endonuclease subunit S [Legionella sp.]|nr:restriction endonuclease subunit S [Legionella sp.]
MSTIHQLITDHIDIWTAADNSKKSGRGRNSSNSASVYGVNKLRELILDLAMRGKLVPQDPNDEPASGLLKRIQSEKDRLIADGKIKKDKSLPPINNVDTPFNLPKGWEWVRNGLLFSLRKGRLPKNLSENKTGLPYLDIDALDRGIIQRYSDDDKCPQSTDNDILVVCDGSRSGFVLNGKDGIIGSTLALIDTPTYIQSFVKLIFKHGYERLNSAMRGAAIPHLDTKNLLLEVIGLPPLAEQYRIVTKVNELMLLCDQMEAQHINATEAHAKLVTHLLDTLTQSKNSAEFNDSWQRIAKHFDTLFTTEASVDALKQTLLQLAVMGKLVPQDLNDEPASELFNRIQIDKAALIADGKIKKVKPLQPISDRDIQCILPNGWIWINLGSLCEIKGGKRLPASTTFSVTETPYIYIQVTNMKDGTIIQENLKYIDEKIYNQIKQYTISSKDLYITIAGTIGAVGSVPEYFCGMNLTENAAKIVFKFLNKEWFKFALKSSSVQKQFADKTKQLAQPKLALHRIASAILALPPIAEQSRIVAKIEELMVLCDQLKAHIAEANQLQQQLADTVVKRYAA